MDEGNIWSRGILNVPMTVMVHFGSDKFILINVLQISHGSDFVIVA